MAALRPSRRRFAPPQDDVGLWWHQEDRHPERLTENELRFSNRLICIRHSRESGNPGASGQLFGVGENQPIDGIVQSPWTPAFAGVTITHGFRYIHFESDSQNEAHLYVAPKADLILRRPWTGRLEECVSHGPRLRSR